jgi:choline dehydrogenase
MIGSPQLLFVSGVGPAHTLKSLNIPVIGDRAGVGQGLQDHAWMHITYCVNKLTISSLRNPEFAAEQVSTSPSLRTEVTKKIQDPSVPIMAMTTPH